VGLEERTVDARYAEGKLVIRGLAIAVSLLASAPAAGGDWPHFRGPNGGVAVGDQKLPAEIGPGNNVIWKTPLPPGHSSPVLHGDRVFLNAVRGKELLTIALDRRDGKVLWEAKAPHEAREKIHTIGSHAQCTPATDGERVVSFFGSSGLICYDAKTGKQLWFVPMGPFKNDFGAANAPLIVSGVVIVGQDHDEGSFLTAIDKLNGQTIWRTDRSEFPVGFANPIIWEVEGKRQIVMAGTLRVVGYDYASGKEEWTVRGLARVVNMTPTVGPDGTLYVAGYAAGADPGARIQAPPWDEMIAKYDANKNGTLELDEMPAGDLKQRFSLIDRDKDGHVTKVEYEGMRRIFQTAQNRMIAIKPGGKGDVTESHVLWSQPKYLPFVPSPLLYRGNIFMVRNGGIVASLDAKTGKLAKEARAGGSGDYYASPVGGDGKIYVLSQQGDLAVASAEAQWNVLHTARFEEDVYATPAIVDGRIYLRTAGHLYCFGLQP
jgi:outer membrane protein assembly factor BamB